MNYKDKYGVAEAISQCWIPVSPDYQIPLEKGDILYGGLDWIVTMSAHRLPHMQGKYLQQGRCLKLQGRLADKDLRVTTSLPEFPGSILIMRYGGLGDVLMMTALLRYFHESKIKCGLACSYEYWQAIRDLIHPNVKVHPIPGKLSDIADYDTILNWNTIEHDRERFANLDRLGAYIYADAAGVPITDPKPWIPRLVTSLKYEAHLKQLESMGVKKLVVMQLTGSTISKSPPHKMMLEAARLLAKDYSVILTARQHDLDKMGLKPDDIEIDGVMLATDKSIGTTFDWLCLISLADLIIAPDSAALHVAVATGQPAIGLFCPTCRNMWYPSDAGITALCGHCEDHPCLKPDMHRLGFPCDHPDADGYGLGWKAIEARKLATVAGAILE